MRPSGVSSLLSGVSALLATTFTLAIACGGTSGSSLTIGAPDGDGGGSTSTDAGSSDAQLLIDGAVVADGGTDPVGAGPGGSLSAISCGNAQCTVPGQACCVYELNNGPPNFSYSCVVGNACPVVANAGTIAMQCSGAANCPGDTVCCASASNGKAATSCKSACSVNEAQLCDPRASVSGCRTDGGACSSNNISDWRLPTTYATCGGVGN